VEQERRKGCRCSEKRRRGIRRKQLLHGFKERDRYLSRKDAATDRTICRTLFGWAIDLSHDRLHSE